LRIGVHRLTTTLTTRAGVGGDGVDVERAREVSPKVVVAEKMEKMSRSMRVDHWRIARVRRRNRA
jgi:hypothetical protein